VGAGAIAAAKALGIDKVGTTARDFLQNADVIYRLPARPEEPTKYQYLVVSDRVEDAQMVDLLVVRDLERIKEKVRAGIGLEIEVAPARKMDAAGVNLWLAQAREVYRFCQSSGCQFVLSSGATSVLSVVSGRCMDALLRACGVNPQKHWEDLAAWLAWRLRREARC
jgi:hypothetical protein